MIDIDTSILREMSNAARASLNEVQAAESKLQSVTEHHDWGCKERGTINEHIRKSRSNMKRIRECGASFYQTVSVISTEFEETEKSIGSMFNRLDGLLGELLNVSAGIGEGIKNQPIIDYQSIIRKIPGFYDDWGVTSPIRIIDFQNLVQGMEDK